MSAVHRHIRSLEAYIERGGARLVRSRLPEWVHGRVNSDVIVLRAGLSPEQEFIALVHELAHWLAHRDVCQALHCTVYEYEAEAVEALVMSRLGLSSPPDESPTDGLLSASVARVMRTCALICEALGVAECQQALKPQTAVDLDAASGEEIVLEDEAHRMRDFLGLPQAL